MIVCLQNLVNSKSLKKHLKFDKSNTIHIFAVWRKSYIKQQKTY